MPDTPPPGRVQRLLRHIRTRPDRGAMLGAWMFPVLCWFVATLYLGGDLGKSTDDYSNNLRDPVTNALPSPFNPMERYPFFWRPLHNIMCFGVCTLWPEANRSLHVAVAAFHGLACLGLFLMLRQLTRTHLVPAIATLLFMVLPLHGEVVFWFSTTSTAIGSALFFAAALVAIAFARSQRPRWPLLWAIFGLVFLAACFYEQSAALSAGLPFLCMAASPPGRPRPARASRAMLATLGAGTACVLYVGLLWGTIPPAKRGSVQSLVTRDRAGVRLHEVISEVRNVVYGERAGQILRGSIGLGWETATSPKGLVLGASLLACAVLWIVWTARRGGTSSPATTPSEGSTPANGRACWLFLAGAASFIAAWLPVYLVDHQGVELRTTYIPLLGAAMMLAGVLDWIVNRFRNGAGAGARLAISVATLAVLAPGIVGLIGYQTSFQRRWRQDQREIAALRRMVPAPAPNTVFMPLRLGEPVSRTRDAIFYRARYGVFETPWSAQAAVQFAYRRNDVGATSCNPWAPAPYTPVDKPDAIGVRWTQGLSKPMTALFPQDPQGGARVPWANAVPFVTDPDGRLRLVRRVDVERADHRDLEIRPPIVHAAMHDAGSAGAELATSVYRFAEPEPEESRADLIPLRFWELADGSTPTFEKMSIWNTTREATWLTTGYRERASMSIPLPPLHRPEDLLIRATMAEFDLDPNRNPFARVQELVFTMASAPERELAVLRLDPLRMRGLKKWISLVVPLPARTGVAGDRLRITPRLAGEPAVQLDPAKKLPRPTDDNASILPIWITHGYEQSIPNPP